MTSTVVLLGSLGDEFGSKFEMRIRNVGEAIKAMTRQLPGFRKRVESMNIRIRTGSGNIKGSTARDAAEAMMHPVADGEVIYISPTTAGAGSNMIMGAFMVIAGIVAIVLAAPTGGASIAAWTAAEISLAAAGAMMVIGGAAMMFTKTPKTATVSSAGTSTNTSFSSIENMTAQGKPYPLLYGKMLTGSLILQQSVQTLPRES